MNEAGTSEQSEAALVSTKGSRAHALASALYCRFIMALTFDFRQGRSSGCSNTRLTLPWNCQWTRPPCTTVTMHLRAPRPQTQSELQSFSCCLSFTKYVMFPSGSCTQVSLHPGGGAAATRSVLLGDRCFEEHSLPAGGGDKHRQQERSVRGRQPVVVFTVRPHNFRVCIHPIFYCPPAARAKGGTLKSRPGGSGSSRLF